MWPTSSVFWLCPVTYAHSFCLHQCCHGCKSKLNYCVMFSSHQNEIYTMLLFLSGSLQNYIQLHLVGFLALENLWSGSSCHISITLKGRMKQISFDKQISLDHFNSTNRSVYTTVTLYDTIPDNTYSVQYHAWSSSSFQWFNSTL